MYQYEATIIEFVNQAFRGVRAMPLILGGITDSGGGTGGPPGGFVGQLPQTRVAYDTDEFATDETPVSGMSILDNLNHIRKNVEDISGNASLTEDKSFSGMRVELTAGMAINFGKFCYMGSDGKMEYTDADSITTCGGWALSVETYIAENATGTFLLHGFARDDGWDWTAGSMLYADTVNEGNFTHIIPSGSNDVVQIVGIAISADIIYFNPQLATVEHV